MTWELLILLAALTYGSRAFALALVPRVPARLRTVLDRVPPALFAGLAAHSISLPGQGLVETPILVGALGAAAVAPRRSLPLCLLAGVATYLVWGLVA
ncbi:MAG TPA: AzlD domain-containing protein [Methylibium sp.]|jgi:branched-subunit amino acid transport protein|nr:AzlD domain-containing protein [Candidatus Limnocylindrales bacterium]HWH74331.1 AzlD domain-containing protein [Methylibium sp.]